MRRFVVIGQKARSSDEFLLDDLPGTSGRLDVLVRCIRAAMLFSHGLRRDVVLYLVLGGGPGAPRALRVSAETARFLRPDERSLAILVKKVLASSADANASGFVEVKPGVALASGGLSDVFADLGPVPKYVLEENAPDIRAPGAKLRSDAAFFLGDHLGFQDEVRAQISAAGANAVSVGPLSLHTEDVITLVSSELDRLEAQTH
jgi:tRNA (pseudouridine54-N1)-methyltransferase